MGAPRENEEKDWGRKLARAKADGDGADSTPERRPGRCAKPRDKASRRTAQLQGARADLPSSNVGPPRGVVPPWAGQAHLVGGAGQTPPLGVAQNGSSFGRGLTSAGPQECSSPATRA